MKLVRKSLRSSEKLNVFAISRSSGRRTAGSRFPLPILAAALLLLSRGAEFCVDPGDIAHVVLGGEFGGAAGIGFGLAGIAAGFFKEG